MNAVRKKILGKVVLILISLTTVVFLILYALRQNISLFYTPEQLTSELITQNRKIRLGGMVVKGSIKRSSEDLSVEFQLTDFKKTISVSYTGILPDLFRDGQGVIAKGTLLKDNQFFAEEILAKHDENYMPPEIKNSIFKEVKNVS
jgi:cytochrome c-type biogenesis protein CcmE